jgi:hypothetical protein
MICNGRIGSVLLILTCGLMASFAISCSSQVQPPVANRAAAVPGRFNLYVNFNGPWAFMQDPDDASKLVAIAPYLKEHESAYVAATNETPVEAGVYEVSGLPSATLDLSPQLVVVKDSIPRKMFDSVAQSQGARYLIRLPMPSDFSSYRNGREAVATTWPVPNPEKTEKWYVTHMTLRYSVSDFGGIKFGGTSDAKKAIDFSPVLGATGTLDIGVGPLYDLQETGCHDHGKGAFKALVGLFKVQQFIDFPGTDGQYHQDMCGPSDPQKPTGPPTASPGHLGRTGADCKAAMVFLSITNP